MKFGLLSDIHGNLEALEAALKFLDPQVDRLICLGDIVGYGPDPVPCLELIFERCGESVILGNHEFIILGGKSSCVYNPIAMLAFAWTEKQIPDFWKARLRKHDYKLSFPEYRFSMAHGSLNDPVDQYLNHPGDCKMHFHYQEYPVCFVGHTHVSAIFTYDVISGAVALNSVPVVPDRAILLSGSDKYVVNPGSVGQPRDGDSRLSVGVFDTDAGTFTNHRGAYDFSETQKKILKAGLPPELAMRLTVGQ